MSSVTHLEVVVLVLVLEDIGADEGDGIGEGCGVGVDVVAGCQRKVGSQSSMAKRSAEDVAELTYNVQ